MKLTCQLEVRNQLAPSSAKKACVCTLALCKDKKNTPVLLACTKQNVAGQKYELKNLKKVFSKFLKDGMSTLSFSAPPHDLLIRKADPLQLRSFLHFLANGEKSNLRFSAPPTKIEAPGPRKLVITRRGDLPNSLPNSLESLTIKSIGLIKVPTSLLQLDRLTSLVLSSNAIESLPTDLGKLSSSLAIVVLSDNALKNVDCLLSLTSLKHLDVSTNQLSSLPERLCDLPSLSHLQISSNQLSRLPCGIGKMKKLKYLFASSNKIEVLPSSFMCLHLEQLDLSGNPLDMPPTATTRWTPSLPTLLEWAAQTTIRHRLPFSEECVPYTLVHYLREENQFCATCSRPVFSSSPPVVTAIDIRMRAYVTFGIDQAGRTTAAIEVTKCFKHSRSRRQWTIG